MKKLILSISSALWLVVQVHAQQATSIATDPSVTVNASSTANKQVIIYTNNQEDQDGDDPMRSKTFSKSFALGKNDKVSLSNQFGSITIKTWEKNEIKVDADIKAYANTESEAQKLIDEASISASKTGDQVAFNSHIGDSKGNWGRGNRNGKKWRREIKIYLTVYMPATAPLTAAQKYGNITLGNFSGPTSLKVEFGDLIADNLSNSNNYISVQYGKATLKDVNQAKIKHQFGDGLTIQSIGAIDLDAQYTAVNIGAIKGDAVIKHRFGKGLTLGTVSRLDLETQYTTVRIKTLRGNAATKINFGKLIVDAMEPACNSFTVNAQHSDVNLAFAANYNADFNVTTNYGGFKYGSNITAKQSGNENNKHFNPSKSYVGQIGKGGADNVSVKAQFGSITFK